MFGGDVAREVDRIVVGGHQVAARHPDRAARLAVIPGPPGVLIGVGAVLARRAVSRADLALVMPYTPPSALAHLVEQNVVSGTLLESDGVLQLTELGRTCVESIRSLQDDAIAEHWASVADAVSDVIAIAEPLLDDAGAPPVTPAAFDLFAGTWDDSAPPARALRLVTAMRYWRADAHRAALAAVDLRPAAAHALNVLWDAHRGVTRVGQGAPETSSTGVAELEARGLATEAQAGGTITAAGIELRETVEADTDRRTEVLYRRLDDDQRSRLFSALVALP